MNTPRTLLAALLAALPVAASADPVTYRGTLGTLDVVVELSSDPAGQGTIAGRYLYLSKGIDIPLQARGHGDAGLELAEEEPCGSEKCGNGEAPPIGAVWTLAPGPGGSLSGTWKGKSRSLPLSLSRAGSREDAEATTPLSLHLASEGLGYSPDMPITMETAPYDVLRLDVPLERSRAQGWADATFNYAVDPRTKFAMPRVVEIAGGSPDRANALLTDRHWRHNLSGFACASRQYVGLNDYGPDWSSDRGTLGGIDEMSTEVHALTPRVMSWQESGSLFCGGAHPYNFISRYVMDVAAGETLALGDMFADVADDLPGQTLVDFVGATRVKPAPGGFDAEHEEECGTDDLVAQYLSASLRRDGDALLVVFGLEDLPHAINACADDLLEIPAADVRHLMTARFAALLDLR